MKTYSAKKQAEMRTQFWQAMAEGDWEPLDNKQITILFKRLQQDISAEHLEGRSEDDIIKQNFVVALAEAGLIILKETPSYTAEYAIQIPGGSTTHKFKQGAVEARHISTTIKKRTRRAWYDFCVPPVLPAGSVEAMKLKQPAHSMSRDKLCKAYGYGLGEQLCEAEAWQGQTKRLLSVLSELPEHISDFMTARMQPWLTSDVLTTIDTASKPATSWQARIAESSVQHGGRA